MEIKNLFTREDWLRNVVRIINQDIFQCEYDTNGLQISIGLAKGKQNGTALFADLNKEDVTMDDFFAPQIFISPYLDNERDIVTEVIKQLIHVYGTQSNKRDKAYKTICKQIGVGENYESSSMDCQDLIDGCINAMKQLGFVYPGDAAKRPIVPEKDKKEKQSNKVKYFCPECLFELETSRKLAEKYPGTPTCVCGCKMGVVEDNLQAEAKTKMSAE